MNVSCLAEVVKSQVTSFFIPRHRTPTSSAANWGCPACSVRRKAACVGNSDAIERK
jgi:hypothetical protein